MRINRRLHAAVCLLIAGASPALAQFTTVATPTAGYTSSTTVLTISPANGTAVPSIVSGSQTVSFSPSPIARTVPGGGWSTWGSPPNTESATPRVLAASGAASMTITLSQPVSTFGFEVEPNNFGLHTITATFMGGAATLGTITLSVNGNAGALLAAAMSTPSITSVVISAPTAGGFAIAQVRFALANVTASIPTVGAPGMAGLAMLLLGAGALLARKQQLAS
jgi:hypothetical protein